MNQPKKPPNAPGNPVPLIERKLPEPVRTPPMPKVVPPKPPASNEG